MDMISDSLQETITGWAEQLIGVPLSALGGHPIPVLTPDREPQRDHPLVIIRCGDGSALVANQDLCEAIRPVMPDLHADLVFSPFGTYEIARATLPLGITIWGPSFYLFGDRNTVRPASDERVVQVGASELAEVDYSIFWHCQQNALAGFAVYEGDEVAALATVTSHGEPVWEIGMETHPDAQTRGLGHAVVNAAANWILENDRIVLATVGTFNIPSARTLRSVGLRYAFMTIDGRPGPFMVQPQPLGSPRPGETLYNYYPDWAITKGILPRPK
ncbi:MAG: GNAT family N-acetyltransferase [Dehalococcoidia bacterium]|nr:GNAT family N-acetyltransferase [Dehalococcoidia bacterium]